ncbi:hypothetical protein BJF83_05190 [Nocardiopsis sp. CNR-923]|nr:hypothetical protein BJF83_05190 [Nocardiopsis sp. CNR-923]
MRHRADDHRRLRLARAGEGVSLGGAVAEYEAKESPESVSATVIPLPSGQGKGAAASRSRDRDVASDHPSRRSRSQATDLSGPGQRTSSRSLGVRPARWSWVTPHHQPMCQESQAMVGTGTGPASSGFPVRGRLCGVINPFNSGEGDSSGGVEK